MEKAKVSFVKFENNDVIATSTTSGGTSFIITDDFMKGRGNWMANPDGSAMWMSDSGEQYQLAINGAGALSRGISYILDEGVVYGCSEPPMTVLQFASADIREGGSGELTTLSDVLGWLEKHGIPGL